MDVNERALLAMSDESIFEDLLQDYKPFIAACASRTTGRFVDDHDDEMSISIMAFSEAVRRYQPASGPFLTFSYHVIRSRLIDHIRSQGRQIDTVSLDSIQDDPDGGRVVDFLQRKQAVPFASRYEDPLKLEIQALTAAIKPYGMSFLDVADCSPRSFKTRSACRKVSACLLSDETLLATLRETRQLPVGRLEKASGVSRKTIARHRNYIVCLVEILSGDYEYLAEYVKNTKGVKS